MAPRSTRMSPRRRESPVFCRWRARSSCSGVILPSRTRREPIGWSSLPGGGGPTAPRPPPPQPRADRLVVAAEGGRHHAAPVEGNGRGGLAELRRHPQDAALPAQLEQLEDVLDVQLLERTLERHRSPRRGSEDVLEIPGRAGAAPSLGGVRATGIELHHPLPRRDGAIVLSLPGQGGA